MNRLFKITILICLVVLSASCRRFNPFADEGVVAKVGDRKLYITEVSSIFTPGLTPEDSVKLLEQYVDVWVKKQLKIVEAEQIFRDSQEDMERLVENYRSSLLGYRLDRYYVENRIDTLLSAAEISDYYTAHRSDFILDRTIVKGLIVRMPENNRLKSRIKELMPQSGERYQDFLDLSEKNNFNVTEMRSWTDFSDFLSQLPTNKLRDYDELLTKSGVQEMRDGADLYLILITDHLKQGSVNPPERVSETIRRIILNQRRQEIIRNYEDSLYRAAVATKEVEIKTVNLRNRD